ncbi:hypothetical protein V6N13_113583 [Hibiscus sabdariffa]|uniref:Uncharacterized protein n=1 Tax=Hibiscus sabdariffa TaxID=183260 RepID=A0ABR2TZB7_9ROSI
MGSFSWFSWLGFVPFSGYRLVGLPHSSTSLLMLLPTDPFPRPQLRWLAADLRLPSQIFQFFICSLPFWGALFLLLFWRLNVFDFLWVRFSLLL